MGSYTRVKSLVSGQSPNLAVFLTSSVLMLLLLLLLTRARREADAIHTETRRFFRPGPSTGVQLVRNCRRPTPPRFAAPAAPILPLKVTYHWFHPPRTHGGFRHKILYKTKHSCSIIYHVPFH